jgi:hypothetical protein
MTARRLAPVSSDDAYAVPWHLGVTEIPDIHRLTNLGRHTLDRVSVVVLSGPRPPPGWLPGATVALGPGESLEIRVPRTVAASATSARDLTPNANTLVVCWRRPGGADYLWSVAV